MPCFPVTSVATPALRQDWRFATNRNAIDGSDGNDPLNQGGAGASNSPFGYFCDDLLGMWIITYFWYTVDPANPGPVCGPILSNLAKKNGLSLDGTPIIKTADELNNQLEANGCGAEGQEDAGGADGGAVWLICPALPDPRAGAIAKDAFLDQVLKPNGAPLDPAITAQLQMPADERQTSHKPTARAPRKLRCGATSARSHPAEVVFCESGKMRKPKEGALSRRSVIGLAAATAAVGPCFAFPDRARASQKTLRIAKWAHFLPEYDAWFEDVLAREWGSQHDTRLVVDHIPAEKIHAVAAAEIEAGAGHDVFMFPWPPAEFHRHVIDHTEIYQTVASKFGNLDRLAHKSTFDPKAKKYFAFANSWIPAPLHYFEDYWGEVGMPLGPVHYGSLRSGAQRIRAKLGVPCGLALAPSLGSNITLHTLLFAFRGRILDPAGNVVIAKNARTIEALKYVKALYADAGTPDQLNWDSAGNVRAMLARKASATVNAISLLRVAEKESPEIAKAIRLSPPLLGSAGVLAFPHVTNCSVVWNFAAEQGRGETIPGRSDRQLQDRLREIRRLQFPDLPEDRSEPHRSAVERSAQRPAL